MFIIPIWAVFHRKRPLIGGVFVLAGNFGPQKENLVFLKHAGKLLGAGGAVRGRGQGAHAGNARAGIGFAALRKRGRRKIGDKPRKIQIVIKRLQKVFAGQFVFKRAAGLGGGIFEGNALVKQSVAFGVYWVALHHIDVKTGIAGALFFAAGKTV